MKYLSLLVAGLLVACTAQAEVGKFAETNATTTEYLGYQVSLYDEVRDCEGGAYYAERSFPDPADASATDGCWAALDDGAGGVFIVALWGTGESEDAFQVYDPNGFDVLAEPDFQDGYLAPPEPEEEPAPEVGI